MKSTIRLFKALPIKAKRKKNSSKELLEKTIRRGFIFSPEVVSNYTNYGALIDMVEKEIGLTPEKLNQAFHKSWKKIKEADILQLVMEQLVHYFTTYGFEEMGIYSEDSVYIPCEKLEIPDINVDKIKLTVIRGYTKKELKDKVMKILASGIALKEETMVDVLEILGFVGLEEADLNKVKNKEVKIALYEELNIVPADPVEFLRYIVYKTTKKTLLIKNAATVEAIKADKNLHISGLFAKYNKQHGLKRLAEIFFRFKPIFLAFKTNVNLCFYINKIRRLANKYHKPMKEDFLNSITDRLSNNKPISLPNVKRKLDEVSIFRKIRLAYALKFRTGDPTSILYRIRNGKGYAKEFRFQNQDNAKKVLKVVLESIIADISKNVKGKKIFIPEYMNYALPATEKQFTGFFPTGSCVTIPKDMVFGVHWENVPHHRIDLDLSLIDHNDGKIGWDSSYRNDERSILFSGDITDAPRPRGATELFYVKKRSNGQSIMVVNYYNYQKDIEVPYKIIVANEAVKNWKENYMVNPNNVLSIAKSTISVKQKILGLIVTTAANCKFYFAETSLGNSITSSGADFIKHSRSYLFAYYKNAITLNKLLEKAGAKMVTDAEKCDIDLTPEKLEKDSILKLLF